MRLYSCILLLVLVICLVVSEPIPPSDGQLHARDKRWGRWGGWGWGRPWGMWGGYGRGMSSVVFRERSCEINNDCGRECDKCIDRGVKMTSREEECGCETCLDRPGSRDPYTDSFLDADLLFIITLFAEMTSKNQKLSVFTSSSMKVYCCLLLVMLIVAVVAAEDDHMGAVEDHAVIRAKRWGYGGWGGMGYGMGGWGRRWGGMGYGGWGGMGMGYAVFSRLPHYVSIVCLNVPTIWNKLN
uniref:Glycine-rich protein n=1 Tax=Steinernema glaseri TaxID=37863 RepID=A0A1I7ZXH1_9BILA